MLPQNYSKFIEIDLDLIYNVHLRADVAVYYTIHTILLRVDKYVVVLRSSRPLQHMV